MITQVTLFCVGRKKKGGTIPPGQLGKYSVSCSFPLSLPAIYPLSHDTYTFHLLSTPEVKTFKTTLVISWCMQAVVTTHYLPKTQTQYLCSEQQRGQKCISQRILPFYGIYILLFRYQICHGVLRIALDYLDTFCPAGHNLFKILFTNKTKTM